MDLKPLNNKGEFPSPSEPNKKAIIAASVIVGILLLVGISYGVYYKVSNTSKQVKNETTNTNNNQVLPSTNTNTNKTSDTSDWQTHKNAELGISFKYPNKWFVTEQDNLKRLKISNTQDEINKSNVPQTYRGMWIAYSQDETSKEREDDLKNNINKFRDIVGVVSKTSIVTTDNTTINLYNYQTGGGPVMDAYWTDKNGQKFYASISSEIGNTIQESEIEILGKILKTVQSITIVDTSDWQTYTNNSFGFEIQYPKIYTLETVKNGIFAIKSPTQNGRYDVNIQVNQDSSLKNLSLDQIINNKVKSISIKEQQKTTLAGQAAYEGISAGLTSEYTVISKHGDNVYELLFNTGNKDSFSANKAALDANQKQIISTFKFINTF